MLDCVNYSFKSPEQIKDKRFTWEKCAQDTMSLIQAVLEKTRVT